MKPSQEHEERSAKLPYNSPEFKKYGSIAHLTRNITQRGQADNPGRAGQKT
jgi:hypothetical protein